MRRVWRYIAEWLIHVLGGYTKGERMVALVDVNHFKTKSGTFKTMQYGLLKDLPEGIETKRKERAKSVMVAQITRSISDAIKESIKVEFISGSYGVDSLEIKIPVWIRSDD